MLLFSTRTTETALEQFAQNTDKNSEICEFIKYLWLLKQTFAPEHKSAPGRENFSSWNILLPNTLDDNVWLWLRELEDTEGLQEVDHYSDSD